MPRELSHDVVLQVKGLAQKELLHSFSHQQAVQELQERQQQMEEEMLQSQEEVESRMQQIQEKEEQYRDADATRLDHIRQQVGWPLDLVLSGKWGGGGSQCQTSL